MSKVFVSYNFGDRSLVHGIEQLFQRGGGRLPGTPVRVTQDLSGQPDSVIRRAIRKRIDQCVVCLFLVGRDVHNSPWIDIEAAIAKDRSMPIVVMRLPGPQYGPPTRLADFEVHDWNSPNAVAALTRAFQSVGRNEGRSRAT